MGSPAANGSVLRPHPYRAGPKGADGEPRCADCLGRSDLDAHVVFAFADFERLTFLALNQAGDGYHLVHRAAADDIRVRGLTVELEGGPERVLEPIVEAGHLVCECSGGRFRGTCRIVRAALARIALHAIETAPDPSLGAGASVEAFRG